MAQVCQKTSEAPAYYWFQNSVHNFNSLNFNNLPYHSIQFENTVLRVCVKFKLKR